MFFRGVVRWIAPFRNVRGGEAERAERPKKERRGKAKPLEVELDLGGECSRANMSISSLPNGKEAHLGVFLDNFKHREGVMMYTQLPDYDNFQCYDLGLGGGRFKSWRSSNLCQSPQAFVASFKTSLVFGGNRK